MPSMDSFAEPPNSRSQQDLQLSLKDVNEQVEALKKEYTAKGIELSGRILHVTHYLPLTVTLTPSKSGVLSPPLTPPVRTTDVPGDNPSPAFEEPPETSPSQTSTFTTAQETLSPSLDPPVTKWTVGPRWGHSAMFSGIHSLGARYEQIVIGWTGDLHRGSTSEVSNSDAPPAKIPMKSLNQQDRASLEETIKNYRAEESNARYLPVFLDDVTAHGHYEGYCKTTLWPLMHYLLWQDVATEYASADQHWAHYAEANYIYAQAVAAAYRPGDLVWVHDYHLLLVPHLLRQLIPEAVVGLFVHTPFPSSEIFRCLPRRREILDGMLGAHLVCFQTYSYSRHFVSSCIRVCGYETSASSKMGWSGIDNQGHVTSVAHCPVGVDAERIARDVARPGVQPKIAALRALYEGKKIIVARDKLDVVKGVVQKLKAFERLMQDYPEWVGNVVLIQVTSPALTDSPKLERQVSELVAHINGEFGALDFVPVHHYHQTIKRDEFYALLSVADLAVITPLRDGMNTTSMEFVIAQQLTKRAPLVLSEFMGISSNMEDALQVNPWDLGGVAAAIHRGLLMPTEERTTRHQRLYHNATTHTSHTWAAMLVRLLLQQIQTEHTTHNTPYLAKDKLHEAYVRAEQSGNSSNGKPKRLFLFDYDGTLTPIVKTPSMALPSPDTLTALKELSADPLNLVYIISGRDAEFLDQHLGSVLPELGMSAEHGSFVRHPGSGKSWSNLTESLDMSWMSEVEEIFRYYTERTAGSHVEIKKSSITWHYRSSDPEWGLFQCRQCQDLLENNLAHKRPIEVLVGKKNLEVRPLAVNKGEIVKRILYENDTAEFVFCAGDDKTDEDMFRALAPFAATPTSIASNATRILEAPLGVSSPPPSSSTSSAYQSASSSAVSSPALKTSKSLTNLSKVGEHAQGGAIATPPKELALRPEGVFATAVGSGTKKTLAGWHVTSPQEVVEFMLGLVGKEPTGEPASAQASL